MVTLSEPTERIEFLAPEPPRLSTLTAELEAIERSGTFSNFGPVNGRLEAHVVAQIFGGTGHCLALNNATTGLMIAIRDARTTAPDRRYALMPSFTFAATAHAALWAGLTPLLYDIDPGTWLGSRTSEDEALDRYGHQIACIVPYATFGSCLELDRYAAMAAAIGARVVVDAAASMGSRTADGEPFGRASAAPVVFSMHATKVLATAEGGLVYSTDAAIVERLRMMANFGFGSEREAVLPGLNGKLPEVGALMGLARLGVLDAAVAHRSGLADVYRAELRELQFQRVVGARVAYQFMPVALPASLADRRTEVLGRLDDAGIGARHYFSPHLAQQPYFASTSMTLDLSNTDDLAARILSLPMSDRMTTDQVEHVCRTLRSILANMS